MVFLDDQDGLKLLYHKSCQVMSVLILPVAIVVALFSYEILVIWTQNPVTAERCHLLLSILIFGTALNGLMTVPYALQLAHGWTRLTLYVNLVSILILVPMIVFLTRKFGAMGGACVWVILNGGYIIITIHLMHKRLLPAEKWQWYWQDVIIPFVTGILIAGIGRILLGNQLTEFMTTLYLIIISISTFGVTIFTTSTTRSWILNKLYRFKPA